jgi:hypothetical protein
MKTRLGPRRSPWIWGSVLVCAFALFQVFSALAEELPTAWEHVEDRVDAGVPVRVFVEVEKTPGRPAFKIETYFEVEPSAAALTLMHDMLDDSKLTKGQRRKVLEQGERDALVYTFIDLPFMLADRELALRIVHSDDASTGVHRVEWKEANHVLPVRDEDVIRLTGAQGYWEFRPHEASGTHAIYVSQTEIGGSIPVSIGDVLMKGQAVDAVAELRGSIEARQRAHVASGRSRQAESESNAAD